ncbi:MAG: 30S ribosomal protein S27ae [Ignisphaera sp.]|uniref:Small ribosomal subunit protein eS31 n=1 Tax=Ignisphaera aggregans TaxID=334771 RepID=A0A7J3MZT9_9CREN
MSKDTKSTYRSSLYEYDYNIGEIKLKNRLCPRCGSVMALHKVGRVRWHCGKCNYTLFVEEKAK